METCLVWQFERRLPAQIGEKFTLIATEHKQLVVKHD